MYAYRISFRGCNGGCAASLEAPWFHFEAPWLLRSSISTLHGSMSKLWGSPGAGPGPGQGCPPPPPKTFSMYVELMLQSFISTLHGSMSKLQGAPERSFDDPVGSKAPFQCSMEVQVRFGAISMFHEASGFYSKGSRDRLRCSRKLHVSISKLHGGSVAPFRGPMALQGFISFQGAQFRSSRKLQGFISKPQGSQGLHFDAPWGSMVSFRRSREAPGLYFDAPRSSMAQFRCSREPFIYFSIVFIAFGAF